MPAIVTVPEKPIPIEDGGIRKVSNPRTGTTRRLSTEAATQRRWMASQRANTTDARRMCVARANIRAGLFLPDPQVGRVDVDFLSGPKPTGTFQAPSEALLAEKAHFGGSRLNRWFGGRSTI